MNITFTKFKACPGPVEGHDVNAGLRTSCPAVVHTTNGNIIKNYRDHLAGAGSFSTAHKSINFSIRNYATKIM